MCPERPLDRLSWKWNHSKRQQRLACCLLLSAPWGSLLLPMMPAVLVARMGFMLGQRYLRPVHVASAYGVKALGSCPAWKSFHGLHSEYYGSCALTCPGGPLSSHGDPRSSPGNIRAPTSSASWWLIFHGDHPTWPPIQGFLRLT